MVICLAYASDGAVIASGSANGVLTTWDAVTGAKLANVQAHHDWIHSVSVSSDNSQLATCAKDQTVKVWDFVSLDPVATFENPDDDSLQTAMFQPETSRVLAAFRTGRIRCWDTQNRTRIDEQLTGFNILGWDFSRDGRTLVTIGLERPLELWRAGSPNETPSQRSELQKAAVYHLGDHAAGWCTALSPDGRFAAVATEQMAASAHHDVALLSMDQPPNYRTLSDGARGFRCVASSPGGRSVFVGCRDGKICQYDIVTGEQTNEVDAHVGGVVCLRGSPDGTVLVSGGRDGAVHIRDPHGSQQLQVIAESDSPVHDVAFSPD